MGTYANSADPVQTPQYAASDQGLRCLLTRVSMQNTVKVEVFTRNHDKYKWTHSTGLVVKRWVKGIIMQIKTQYLNDRGDIWRNKLQTDLQIVSHTMENIYNIFFKFYIIFQEPRYLSGLSAGLLI